VTRALAVVAVLVPLLVATPARADRAVARARVEEARARLAAGDRATALSRLEEAIAHDPDYLPAYDAAIQLWLAGGAYPRMVARLSWVTLRHPDYLAGWYALGYAYRKLGKADLAIACYETYIAARADDPDPHFGLAMAALDRNEGDRAIEALVRYLALERRPDHAEYVARARAELVRLGVEVGAHEELGAAADGVAPARGLLAEGRAGSAIAALQGVGPTGGAPGRAERQRLIAAAELVRGDLPAARQAAALALAEGPVGADLYRLLAELARQDGAAARAAYFDDLAATR
jgi:tetratricopeptide (TPR) repeat protein